MTTIPGRGFRRESRPASPPTPRGMRPGTRPEGYGDTNIRPASRLPQSIGDKFGSQAGRPVRPQDRLDRVLPNKRIPRTILDPNKRPAVRVKMTYVVPVRSYASVGNPFNRPGYSGGMVGASREPHSYGGSNYGTRGSTFGGYSPGVGQAGGFGGFSPSRYR